VTVMPTNTRKIASADVVSSRNKDLRKIIQALLLTGDMKIISEITMCYLLRSVT